MVYGLLWMTITLLPISHLIPIGTTYAERLFYLPSVGACVVLGWLLSLLRSPWRPIAWTLLVVLAGARGFHRSTVWSDAERFYAQSVADTPNNPTALTNLGVVVAEKNRLAEAEDLFLRALDSDPDMPPALVNLAILRDLQNRPGEALALLQRATENDPGYARGWFALGNHYAGRGQRALATDAFERTLAVHPGHPGAQHNLSILRAGQ